MENKTFKRLENGLIEGVEYKYKEDGTIDWRAMINPKYLVINKQHEEKLTKQFGKPLAEIPVTEVDDNKLLILLQGIKDLAALRGYTSVRQTHVQITDSKAVVATQIDWIPNIETNGLPVSFGDVGSASFDNTSGFGKMYLESIAANRAFVRAVRNSLGIAILANDEIDQKATEEFLANEKSRVQNPFAPLAVLEKSMNKAGISFDTLKSGVIAKYRDKVKSDPNTWEGLSSIPVKDIPILLELVNKPKN